MKLLKSKAGFTLIELLVVIGILAVLAAIAIPSVAGLIDRANVSADKTNTNEMTNAVERFTSEYELYCQDIASGMVNIGNMDAAQGRVYNVIGVTDRAGITALEVAPDAVVEEDQIAIYRDTKYPANAKTMRAVIENYTKTSSSTFEPKQSDMHYWYSPDCGVVVFDEPDASVEDLNAQIQSGMNAKGNALDASTQWVNLTESYYVALSAPKEVASLSKKTWKGLTNFEGQFIWTDGKNIYYSEDDKQYVLNGDTWEPKTWNGLTSFKGTCVWSDGTNMYYTTYTEKYVLNGDTWTTTSFGAAYLANGSNTWTDGTTLYHSSGSNRQYEYSNGKWIKKEWKGISNLLASYIWNDGKHVYYSNYGSQYILNGDTWEPKTWDGYSNLYGGNIWTDGVNYYFSSTAPSKQCVLKNGEWVTKEWDGLNNFSGYNVWSDGTNYYYSNGTQQYVFS